MEFPYLARRSISLHQSQPPDSEHALPQRILPLWDVYEQEIVSLLRPRAVLERVRDHAFFTDLFIRLETTQRLVVDVGDPRNCEDGRHSRIKRVRETRRDDVPSSIATLRLLLSGAYRPGVVSISVLRRCSAPTSSAPRFFSLLAIASSLLPFASGFAYLSRSDPPRLDPLPRVPTRISTFPLFDVSVVLFLLRCLFTFPSLSLVALIGGVSIYAPVTRLLFLPVPFFGSRLISLILCPDRRYLDFSIRIFVSTLAHPSLFHCHLPRLPYIALSSHG